MKAQRKHKLGMVLLAVAIIGVAVALLTSCGGEMEAYELNNPEPFEAVLDAEADAGAAPDGGDLVVTIYDGGWYVLDAGAADVGHVYPNPPDAGDPPLANNEPDATVEASCAELCEAECWGQCNEEQMQACITSCEEMRDG